MAEDTKTRDSLAKDRTDLANERTLLAYWRTSLAFFISGAVLLRIDNSMEMMIVSGVLIAFGLIVFIFSITRFIKYRKKIQKH